MRRESLQEKVIRIPVVVFESAETKEEVEDWLMAHDPLFVAEMEKIRKEESGRGISLKEVSKKWLAKS